MHAHSHLRNMHMARTRGRCILELLTALDENMPIVCVVPLYPDQKTYNFAEAAFFLQNLERKIDRVTGPGTFAAIKAAYRGETPFKQVLKRLANELPKIISKKVS